jgi:hypothetical protein
MLRRAQARVDQDSVGVRLDADRLEAQPAGAGPWRRAVKASHLSLILPAP